MALSGTLDQIDLIGIYIIFYTKSAEYKYMETKQQIDQRRNQTRNQKLPWDKWKWKYKDPKFIGHSKSNPKMEIRGNIDLSQTTRIISNNLTLHQRN